MTDQTPPDLDSDLVPEVLTSPPTTTGVELRQRAEASFRAGRYRCEEELVVALPENVRSLVHELRVHQIELEMQNEELRRTQDELRAERARFRELFDRAPVGYLIVSENGLIRQANVTISTVLGIAQCALLDHPVSDFLHRDDQDTFYFCRKRLVETGKPQSCELRVIDAEGRPHWMRLAATILIDDDATLSHRITLSDLSENKRNEAALRQSETFVRSILDAIVDEIAVLNRDGVIIAVNEAWRRFGMENSVEPGKHPSRAFVGDNYLTAFWGAADAELSEDARIAYAGIRAVLDGAVPDFRMEYACHSLERMRWFTMRVSRWETDQHGVVVAHEEITSQKVLQDQLRQSQKLEAIGLLAGGVAHDFNNLLTVIIGNADFLIGTGPSAETAREFLMAIQDAGTRAAELTAQLLAFSRKSFVAPKVLDLNSVTEAAARMLRRLIGEDKQLVTKLATTALLVKIDPSQLDQILMNLVVNARDAMPNGGVITISTAAVQITGDHVHPSGVRPGYYTQLRISDTGQGMSEEVRSRLFEPFYTTKGLGRGTGLGLATVYGIIQQAGGAISVESQVGQGTCFQILFPAVPEAVMVDPKYAATAAAAGTETILLAEDEPLVRKLARRVLESHGYTVLEADSGATAIRAAERCETVIHLLLTDVVMPDVGGRELAQTIQGSRPGIAVLFMSGYTNDGNFQQGIKLAAPMFLQKPFAPMALLQRVREVLDTAIHPPETARDSAL